jgi:hypothetical protein
MDKDLIVLRCTLDGRILKLENEVARRADEAMQVRNIRAISVLYL